MAEYFAGGHLRFVNGEWRDDNGDAIDAVVVTRCKDCKYGDYDSKPDGAIVCLRTNDGFWRKETDFCSYGEYQTNTGGVTHD